MPASGFISLVLRPLRSPLWWLAGASAATLFNVAAVAWKAANRQRLDGEGALRQVAADAAQRALKSSIPGATYGMEDPATLLKKKWFTQSGAPDDWIFGPWPQPENEFSKAFGEVQLLHRDGRPGEALKAFTAPDSPLADYDPTRPPGPVWTSFIGSIRTRFPFGATTTSGLPLGPLLLRYRMETADDEAVRRTAALDLLKAAVVLPSPLTATFIDEASTALGEHQTSEETQDVAAARATAGRQELLRFVARRHRGEIAAGQRWIAGDWHFSQGSDDRLVAATREELASMAKERGYTGPAGPGLPADWTFTASLDGVNLDGQTVPPGSVMAFAVSGPWQLRVICPDPAAAFASLDAQLARQRWLIGGSTGFMGMALAGFVFVLRRQRKLNAMMSNFVASVSHELRAPIGSMGLLAERLGEGRTSGAEEQMRYHQLIRGECRRLSATIDNVLAFSRMERRRQVFEPELSDLTSLLRDAANLIRPLAEERGISLGTEFPEQPVERELDPVAVRQAALNLLDNALKFSPPGGTIHLSLQESNGDAIITVRDEGPGIPPAERNRIFEPFYRIGSELRRETPGIGIGLAIVRDVADAHGGSACAGDAPGTGAEFVLRLGRIPDTPP